ncbi:kinase-like protein [Thelephora ganbajun]|uniref:Kinase-like protein n=1 Tax=Thelephora ganbajun TaxID=370292 RepID=A0ACB6ZET5_THEGA|nr:kinase-like protein [Thelephora ganbajun]
MAPANPRSSARNTKSKRKFSNNVPPGLHYLPPLDPKSEEFAELFRSFLMSKDERTNILALSDEDARLFIEIVDRVCSPRTFPGACSMILSLDMKAFRAARLETELRQLAFSVLRRLCAKIGHLPDSYLLSDKFDLSGLPRASGGFADVRRGVFKGKDVAVKSLRVSEVDDKARIRKHFCKEVAMWKNLFHPNVLNLIGVPDTLEDGRFSMVSEWMANGNIMEYVRSNASNHLKLLADAIEGLKYLHNANIVHGDLKGANILITNTNPVSACLADFGFMTIVHDPNLGMESSKSIVGGGTTPFMAPELLVPSRFKLDKCTPTKEADVYAMAMVIYQVLTGTLPFGKLSGSEVVFKVLGGDKPSKPANALELGLFDKVWKLLEGCWQTERTLRPSVKDVLGRIKAAASVCGTLSPVGGVPQRYEDPDSDFTKFDQLFLGTTFGDEEFVGGYPMERPPSQESTLTDTSTPDSLFSKLSEASEAESSIAEPARASTDVLARDSYTKGGSSDDLPAPFFSPASDHVAHFQLTPDPVSRSSTPGSEPTVRPRPLRDNSGPYRNKRFAESGGSSRTLLPDVMAPQQEQPRPDTDSISINSTVVSHDREPHTEKSLVGDLVALPDAAAIAMAQARDDPIRQLRRPPFSYPTTVGQGLRPNFVNGGHP